MEKIKIDSNIVGYPMPMTIIGALVEGKANFMAAAWVTRVNYKPPLMGVALGRLHHTSVGVHENKTFSINIPDTTLMKETDYCGLVSGKEIDKSKLFDIFYGELKTAPMIKQCPVTMECRVVNAVDMEIDTLFIGEIVGAYTEEKFLAKGNLDIRKIKSFLLTMPDNNYWDLGNNIGKAWSAGEEIKPE
ncbi:MAG: flavin reductase family protein [Candidatus Omnitrophota bacterium]|jgi:flavin reductase (DIM6/NTAB) family NADH-FMN oxidoreductase RutF